MRTGPAGTRPRGCSRWGEGSREKRKAEVGRDEETAAASAQKLRRAHRVRGAAASQNARGARWGGGASSSYRRVNRLRVGAATDDTAVVHDVSIAVAGRLAEFLAVLHRPWLCGVGVGRRGGANHLGRGQREPASQSPFFLLGVVRNGVGKKPCRKSSLDRHVCHVISGIGCAPVL
jgi:hypothetical protein